MISATYLPCPAIEIYGWKGRAIDGPGTVMEMDEFVQFRDRIVEQLETIAKSSTGQVLFAAIRATGKQVRIHSADGAEDNAAKMDPNVVANGPNAAIKSFRPAHHNVNLALKGSEAAWKGLDPKQDRSEKKAQIKAQMAGLGLPTTKAEAAPVLRAVLQRAHIGMTLTPQITNNRFRRPEVELPKRLGISHADFDDMLHGMKYMPDGVYYPLCFLLYDYHLPGAGTNAQVRVMTESMFEHDFKGDLADEARFGRRKSETRRRLEATVLGHELIHAWRMMAGRRIVSGGWEEEAMTSGIGPFANWKMTENSFRRDFKLKSRTTYGSPTHSSELSQNIAQTTGKSYKGVLF